MPRILDDGRTLILARLIAWGLCQGAISISAALVVKRGFHVAFGSNPAESAEAGYLAAGLTGLALALVVFRVLERGDAEALGQRYASALRVSLLRHLMRATARSVQARRRGHLMLRFVGDLTSMRLWISSGLARLAVSAVAITTAAITLWFVHPALSFALLAMVGVIGIALMVLGRPLRRRIREARRRRGRIAGNMGEKLGGIAAIQAHGQPLRELRRLRRQNERLTSAMVARMRIAALVKAVPEAAIMLATGAVILVGVTGVADAGIDAGTAFAAIVLLGILGRPLGDLARIFDYHQNYRIGREKILSILQMPTRYRPERETAKLQVEHGEIAFKAAAIEGIVGTFVATVRAGTKVAIIGPNGAGKSTLLLLAAGLVIPDRGAVTIDGTDLSACSRASVRRHISIASRDVPLLSGTIGSNLRARWPDAPADAIARACRASGLDRVLTGLPDGLETRVAEAGGSLPAGLRQRLSLARAIIDDPMILLLDETDAELDGEALELLHRLITARKGTTLFVTHDPKRAAWMDDVWTIADGRILLST